MPKKLATKVISVVDEISAEIVVVLGHSEANVYGEQPTFITWEIVPVVS